MGMAELVAWATFAVLIGWLGWVLWATYSQIDVESRDAATTRERRERTTPSP